MDTTLLKGLTVFEALVRRQDPPSVSDLAAELGLVRSNVHRTLETLMHAGYVQRVPGTARFQPSTKVWELGTLIAKRFDVRALAKPFLDQVSKATSETVLLAVLDGFDAIYVDKVEALYPVRTDAQVGSRMPAHCLAIGKAMLAFAPTEVLQGLPSKLARHTRNTIVTRNALLAELEAVRARGHAINDGEYRDGVCGFGVPVFGMDGRCVAGLSISCPKARFGAASRAALAKAIPPIAAALSKRLCSPG